MYLTSPPPVYVAAPLGAERLPGYSRALEAVRSRHPDARLIEGVRAFRDDAHWRARWPGVLAGVRLLVVVPGARGVVGAGVIAEMADARARRIPVRVWDGRRPVPLDRAALRILRGAHPARLARVEVS